MLHALSKWKGNRRGSAAIEFALAFPVILGLTMGIVEIAHIAFAENTLEGAVREASRHGVTGYVPQGGTREAYVRSQVTDRMAYFGVDGPVEIDTRVYDSFGDIGKPEPYSDNNANGSYDAGECFTDINQNGRWDPDMGAAGLGGSGAIVVYRATVRLRLLTPVFAWMIGDGARTITLDAATAVRNEPFNLIKQSLKDGAPTLCI
ncbi:MAG: TadE/TadG family type IV pilus assembly protein [Rhodothalassiaceae bacterium]